MMIYPLGMNPFSHHFHPQGANQCFECRNANDNGYCVVECPGDKYEDSDRQCQACDEQCQYGCYAAVSTSTSQYVRCSEYEYIAVRTLVRPRRR